MRGFDQLFGPGANRFYLDQGSRGPGGQSHSELLADHLDGAKVEKDEERFRAFSGKVPVQKAKILTKKSLVSDSSFGSLTGDTFFSKIFFYHPYG